MLCRELRKKYPKNRSGCIASVVKKNWDSKGITVPLAGGLEDSVLQGLNMLQKTQVHDNSLFYLYFTFHTTIDKET